MYLCQQKLVHNAAPVDKYCWELAEFLIVTCRPFYLPREFSCVIVVAVYIASSPNANTNEALRPLYVAVSELLTKPLDSFVLVAGDFNHTSL